MTRILFASIIELSMLGSSYCQVSSPPPPHRVTYVSSGDTPMNAVSAIALQSHAPIGIVIGEQQNKLCQTPVPFDIRDMTVKNALAKIGAASEYSLRDENGVLVLVASDLTRWQEAVLKHRFEAIGGDPKVTMSVMATRLTGWIRMAMGNVTTFAGATLYSPDSQEINMPALRDVSVEEVADFIVTRGDKGMWVLHGATENPTSPAELTVDIYSYHDDEASLRHLSCKTD